MLLQRMIYLFIFNQKYLALRRKSKLQMAIIFGDQIYFIEECITLEDGYLKSFFSPKQIHLSNYRA